MAANDVRTIVACVLMRKNILQFVRLAQKATHIPLRANIPNVCTLNDGWSVPLHLHTEKYVYIQGHRVVRRRREIEREKGERWRPDIYYYFLHWSPVGIQTGGRRLALLWCSIYIHTYTHKYSKLGLVGI